MTSTAETRAPARPAAPRRRRPTSAHLMDYVGTVRSHGLVAFLVAAAIGLLVVGKALYATPVYVATARLEIDMGRRSSDSVFSDLMFYGGSTQQGTEMEILRSYIVASLAAGDPAAHATALLEEEHAYRPLETLLRSFNGEAFTPCVFLADATPLLARHTATWRLHVDPAGTTVTVERGNETVTATGVTLGEPFVDENHDGRWNRAEPFTDRDGDQHHDEAETYVDQNVNGKYDEGEPFVDLDDNGEFDPIGEAFLDENGNGRRDEGEPFQDLDGNGSYDIPTPFEAFGKTIALTRAEGDPRGRTFLLVLRAPGVAARWIHGGSQVQEVGNWTGILDLHFRASTPDVAARIANAVARAYMGLKRSRKQERLDLKLDWLRIEIAKIEADLRAAYHTRDTFVGEVGAAHLSERARGFYDQQAEMIKQRFEVELTLNRLDAMIYVLTEGRSSDELLVAIGASNLDARTQALVTNRTDLEIERAVLVASGAGEMSPVRKEVDSRLPIVNQQLREAVQALVAERRMELGRERESATASLQRVIAEEKRLQGLLDDLPEVERRVIELARPILTNETFYASLRSAQKEAEMARASAISGANLIDPAFAPTARKSPHLAKIMITAILLSLFGGLGIAFLLEYLNRRVKTPQDLEDGLGLSIYASIPDFKSVKRRERGGKGTSLVTITAPSSVLAEAYRTLRANIRFATPDEPVQTLAITSSVQSEGKTVTTLNLAVVMAKAGAKVIVVDADMRRPRAHTYLGGSREPGLVDVLRGEVAWQDVRYSTEVEDLQVLPAGRSTENPGALLDSDAFTTLLQDLKQEYEYVLFDVPPVLAVADAASFFRQLDAVFLLVRYNQYGVEVAQGAQEQIERLHGNLLGIVFNAFDARRSARSGYGYHGYYGYYSRYGYREKSDRS